MIDNAIYAAVLKTLAQLEAPGLGPASWRANGFCPCGPSSASPVTLRRACCRR